MKEPSWTSRSTRGRIRQHDGPKRRRDTDPGLLQALDRLVEPDTRGDPESPLRWTCKSTRELAGTLTAPGSDPSGRRAAGGERGHQEEGAGRRTTPTAAPNGNQPAG